MDDATQPMQARGDDAAQAQDLQRWLEQSGHACELRWIAETGSTNTDLLALVRDAAGATAHCLVTGHQRSGRGRRAKPWSDDARAGALLCSLAWPLPRGCDVTGLSLGVGVWLVQALRTLGLRGAALKWPNDLLVGQRKLAGVLIEVADTPLARWVVIGIGLNLRAPQGLAQATGLLEQGLQIDRWQVLRALLPRLLLGLQEFAQRGFAPWAQEWNQLHAWRERAVRVLGDGVPDLHGVALGVDDHGFLWLQTPRGRERVTSGDVSLRAASD